ncbi:SIR2 family protein, partial [Acinetobacter towneri]|uniref:SIR2 family protein n=1 Tax=Acinetobacter towneri TaxID=202956 RepID=UPI0032138221
MNYERALTEAKKGRAIIFLGAGFSFGLTSAFGKKVPTGSGLAKLLCDEIQCTITDDLKKATKRYLKNKSTDNLIDLLKDHFIIRNVDEKYIKIASIPWKSIYTTNYDNCFEVAGELIGKRFESFDSDTNPKGKVLKNSVIHINGFINNLNNVKLETSFKLTTPSYLTEQFRNSVWAEVFRRDIQAANAIFFVGYSMYDIDIQEILFAEKELKDKIFFIDRDDLTEDEIEDLDISDFGKVLPIGIDKFANDFDRVDSLAISHNSELIISSFEKIEIDPNNISKVKDTDIFSLLINGELKDDLLINEVTSNENNYVISREQENIAFGDLKDNKNLILYGDLSNGKTVTAKIIAFKLIKDGYNVFELKDFYLKDVVFNEIDEILKRFEKNIFIIENYTANMDVVSHINIARNNDTKMLLISRTFEHEKYIDDILFNKKQLDVNETFEEPLDKISNTDVEKFIRYFDRYGLWGDKASFNELQKKRYIINKANNEIHGILLGILESTAVKSKIDLLFKEMVSSELVLRNILAILCLNISNVSKVTHHLVAAMTNDSSIFSSRFREKSIFYQLVNENNEGFLPKSSVLSEYILANFPSPDLLVNNLIFLCKNIHSKSLSRNDTYMQIYKDLASFRYAQKILPNKNKRESLINFYEGLREIEQERKN